MKSNVDWTICPECSALNAAQWNQHGLQSYDVSCGDCGHEYERGRFASDGVRLLVHKDEPKPPSREDIDILSAALGLKSSAWAKAVLHLTDPEIQNNMGHREDYWEEI